MLRRTQTVLLNRLTQCIELRRLTQSEIARETGVHQSQVSRIIAGKALRASRNVLKLCKYAETLLDETTVEGDAMLQFKDALRDLIGDSPSENQALDDLLISLRVWKHAIRQQS